MSSPGLRIFADRDSVFFERMFDFPYVFAKEIKTGSEIMFGSLNITNQPCFGYPEEGAAL